MACKAAVLACCCTASMISLRSFPWRCLIEMGILIKAEDSLWRRFFVLNLLYHSRFLQPSLALFFLLSPFPTLREGYNTDKQHRSHLRKPPAALSLDLRA